MPLSDDRLAADGVYDTNDDPTISAGEADTGSSFSDDVIMETHDPTNERTLPSFRPAQSMSSSWGDLSGEDFTKVIDDAYAQVVHWRPNLFKAPSGKCGKQFVAELTRLFNTFAMESDLESIALKAAMTLPSLMLQKPHVKSKTHDHIFCLQRRLSLWERGDILNLKEGKALQKSLTDSHLLNQTRVDVASTARRFSKMMMEGRVRADLRLLPDNSDKGPLSLNDTVDDTSGNTVRDVLEEKHPRPGPVHPEALVEGRDDDNFHPIIYDGITTESIRTAALQTQGAAGPSGLDALNWRRLCTAFGQSLMTYVQL